MAPAAAYHVPAGLGAGSDEVRARGSLILLDRHICRRAAVIAALGVCVLLAAGCAHDRPLSLSLRPDVHRPSRCAVLFFIDGVGYQDFSRLAGQGALPNIRRELIDRGTSVDLAVSCHPTLTYAITTSLLTGQYPGHHGVLGNKWFDRRELRMRDYAYIRTYRLVGYDFAVPTIYEYLAGRYTVSIQCANRRGVTRSFDNWATSGINWFFGNYQMVDKLVAIRFEQMADEANRVGHWPTFIHAYFPAVDEIGHRYGPGSREHRRALMNVDRQIGRICQGLRDAGLMERTYLVLVSDHGMAPTDPRQALKLTGWLQQRFGLAVSTTLDEEADNYPERFAKYDKYQAAAAISGDRAAVLTFRLDRTWRDPPADTLNARVVMPGPEGPKVCDVAVAIAREPAVAVVAARDGPDHVMLYAGERIAGVARRAGRSAAEYTYLPMTGDPLGYADCEATAELVGGWHSAEEWFVASGQTRYPDAVPQIVSLFDHPRTGDLVVFAAEGCDFVGRNRGGHGSILAEDMHVPMVFAGPGVPAGGRWPRARLIDVTPTILDLLGVGYLPEEFDGTSLTALLPADQQASATAAVR